MPNVKNGQRSVIIRRKLLNANSTSGSGLTGLTFNSAGLVIGMIADNEAVTTSYTQVGGKIETITTLGTYVAPTATKCRFKEVDATVHPGLYEFQFADARFAVSAAKALTLSVNGVSGLQEFDYEVPLDSKADYGLAEQGRAQSVGADTITLDANSTLAATSAPFQIFFTDGAGLGEMRYITSIDTSVAGAHVATVSPNLSGISGTPSYDIFGAPPLPANGPIAAIAAWVVKVETMTQIKGVGPTYQWTTNAMELGPTGSGSTAATILAAIDAGNSVRINSIYSKTFQLTATPGDVNVVRVNGILVSGNGTTVPMHA